MPKGGFFDLVEKRGIPRSFLYYRKPYFITPHQKFIQNSEPQHLRVSIIAGEQDWQSF
jgi:hypothetical protein